MPREPTKHQLSSRLTYSQQTPAFLRKLQSRVSGIPDEDSDENPEFEDDGSGRPPIPRRPAIPERPADDPGSEDEDGGDEAPQVVILKEGKHLSAWEVGNERRKAKGLPPLPDPAAAVLPSSSLDDDDDNTKDSKSKKRKEAITKEKKSLSFSSGPPFSSKSTTAVKTVKKRKAVGDGRAQGGEEEKEEEDSSSHFVNAPAQKHKTKKPKVGLSFADDA